MCDLQDWITSYIYECMDTVGEGGSDFSAAKINLLYFYFIYS